MDIDRLIGQLIRHEGIRQFPYTCNAGKLTIGVGRNLEDKGLSRLEIMTLLKNDIDECYRDLSKLFPEWDSFSDDRHHALMDMRFNLGPCGFRQFQKMIDAIKENDWSRAADEAIASKWARQVGRRAVYISGLMR